METIKDNEIGKIDRILYYGDKYFIIDALTRSVFIFNKNGQYNLKINAVGNGLGEYAQITDIAVDKFQQTIKV